jgi:HSP20 family protein
MPIKRKPADGDKTPPDSTNANMNIDLGFGGLFKGLGDFMDVLSNMMESGQTETTQTGEFNVKGLGDKARGVYGLSIRSGLGGVPQVERFGNIRATTQGPVVADVREPLVDVFDEGEEMILAAELPGVSEAEITVEAQEDILSLQTTGERKYAKEILLAHPVDPATMRKTYKNGILEIRLKKV